MVNVTEQIEQYIQQLPDDRQQAVQKIRTILKDNLPSGFEETMAYGMIGYVVPHRIFPEGYHCNPKEPLPFISLASQKNFIALYHMGLYAIPETLEWFQGEYPKHVKTKLDMGKSCIRFKKVDSIPYDLIAQLSQKITVEDYIQVYKKNIRK